MMYFLIFFVNIITRGHEIWIVPLKTNVWNYNDLKFIIVLIKFYYQIKILCYSLFWCNCATNILILQYFSFLSALCITAQSHVIFIHLHWRLINTQSKYILAHIPLCTKIRKKCKKFVKSLFYKQKKIICKKCNLTRQRTICLKG